VSEDIQGSGRQHWKADEVLVFPLSILPFLLSPSFFFVLDIISSLCTAYRERRRNFDFEPWFYQEED
jgi:hypothetical protein